MAKQLSRKTIIRLLNDHRAALGYDRLSYLGRATGDLRNTLNEVEKAAQYGDDWFAGEHLTDISSVCDGVMVARGKKSFSDTELLAIAKRFLNYSLVDVEYIWDNLTDKEKTFCTQQEFDALVQWLGPHTGTR